MTAQRTNGRRRKGPSPRVAEGIRRATAMLAAGETYKAAANVLGVTEAAVHGWRKQHGRLWAAELDRAIQVAAVVTRRDAGSDAVLVDPGRQLRRAAASARSAKSTGRPPSFSSGNGDSLGTFYEAHYRPACLAGFGPRTVDGYDDAMRRWLLLTGDPPLQEIDQGLLTAFEAAIGRLPGSRSDRVAPATVYRVVWHVRAVLKKAGPPGPDNRDGLGLLPVLPWPAPPRGGPRPRPKSLSRLVPDAPVEKPLAEMTLPEFYASHVRPCCLPPDASPGYQAQIIIALGRWQQIIGDVPIREVTAQHVAHFRDTLGQQRGWLTERLSPTTVNNKLRIIRYVLRNAGPPGPRYEGAADVLDRVPWVRPPRNRERPIRVLTDEELSALHDAADRMDRPEIDGVAAADWWRALLVFAFYTGLRRGTIFGLEWTDLDEARKVMTIPGDRMKAGRDHVVPVNAIVLDHLNTIKGNGRLLFAWPYSANSGYFGRLFRRLWAVAGLPPEKGAGLHYFRKTLATRLAQHASLGAAKLAPGHAADDVTRRHYVQAVGPVAEALNRIPAPAAFGQANGNGRPRRRRKRKPTRAG